MGSNRLIQLSGSCETLCGLQGKYTTKTLHLEEAALCGMGPNKFTEG